MSTLSKANTSSVMANCQNLSMCVLPTFAGQYKGTMHEIDVVTLKVAESRRSAV
jgi:hypothetical protein